MNSSAADAVEVAVDYAVAFLQVATFQQYGAGTEIEQGLTPRAQRHRHC